MSPKFKFVMRQIGTPDDNLDVYSVKDVEEYLDYQAKGYELHSTHYLGEVKYDDGRVAGYRFGLWFVKSG